MLQLNQPPFAQGGHRAIYFHPENSQQCIKVLLPASTPENKKAKAPWWKKVRNIESFDDNVEEHQVLKHIENWAPDIIGQHIPRCYGFVDTTKGSGLITDVYRDFDGNISPNLLNFLQQHGAQYGVLEAIQQFQEAVYKHQILSRALLLHNIVVQRLDKDNCRLFLIDGIGNPEFIPISNVFVVTRKLKIKRKIKKMKTQVGMVLRGEPL